MLRIKGRGGIQKALPVGGWGWGGLSYSNVLFQVRREDKGRRGGFFWGAGWGAGVVLYCLFTTLTFILPETPFGDQDTRYNPQ